MKQQPILINPKRAYRRLTVWNPKSPPIKIKGEVRILHDKKITHIAPQLVECESLVLNGCTNLFSLPEGLTVGNLSVIGCTSLRTLPENLQAGRIYASGSGLMSISESLQVRDLLDLRDCEALVELPDGLTVRQLMLSGCTSLEDLPDRMTVSQLDVSGCTSLLNWGEGSTLVYEESDVSNLDWSRWNPRREPAFVPHSLNASNCPNITELPDWLETVSQLDIRNCVNLKSVSQDLTVLDTIELADSGLLYVPAGVPEASLRWNTVTINTMIAFRPDKLTARAVLRESNAEVRRVMLERMGYRRFFDEADPDLIDLDKDAGGERMLLRVEIERDLWWRNEPIVCLAVFCPSTGHQYVLRVPPNMNSCHQAAAWLAGFDDPKRYKPLIEA